MGRKKRSPFFSTRSPVITNATFLSSIRCANSEIKLKAKFDRGNLSG
jgi:hypothetical protein